MLENIDLSRKIAKAEYKRAKEEMDIKLAGLQRRAKDARSPSPRRHDERHAAGRRGGPVGGKPLPGGGSQGHGADPREPKAPVRATTTECSIPRCEPPSDSPPSTGCAAW